MDFIGELRLETSMQEEKNIFFQHWPHIKENWEGKDVLLFLDYDGTLTPIVEHPSLAVLSPEVTSLLNRLNMNDRCRVTIVSGRSLEDLMPRVGLKKLTYVGNHGFEILGPDIRFENSCFFQTRNIYNRIIEGLQETLAAMPDAFIEDKRITVSIHVRRLSPEKKPLFKKVLYKLIMPYVESKDIYLREGKEVYELRPPVAWDKGAAVLWLLKNYRKQSTVSIYIGDDQTDEDAFKALKDQSVTIKVGSSLSTAAQYWLGSPNEVAILLAEIESLLRNDKS